MLMSGVLSGSVHAVAKAEDQPALVVSVENHGPQSNSNDAGPLDLPLQPRIYPYDVGIRAGSTIYRTRVPPAYGSKLVFQINNSISEAELRNS